MVGPDLAASSLSCVKILNHVFSECKTASGSCRVVPENSKELTFSGTGTSDMMPCLNPGGEKAAVS